MRRLADRQRLLQFMSRLGQESREPGRIYFTGGATALLNNWRATTIDVDLFLDEAAQGLLSCFPAIKEELQINIELACPSDFIPELPGWRERSLFIAREGRLDFFHYDFYAQALAKIERGHEQDKADVANMLKAELVEPARALELFEQIEPMLYRYPALDPPSFRRRIESVLRQ